MARKTLSISDNIHDIIKSLAIKQDIPQTVVTNQLLELGLVMLEAGQNPNKTLIIEQGEKRTEYIPATGSAAVLDLDLLMHGE